jgi:hypothetical protein
MTLNIWSFILKIIKRSTRIKVIDQKIKRIKMKRMKRTQNLNLNLIVKIVIVMEVMMDQKSLILTIQVRVEKGKIEK